MNFRLVVAFVVLWLQSWCKQWIRQFLQYFVVLIVVSFRRYSVLMTDCLYIPKNCEHDFCVLRELPNAFGFVTMNPRFVPYGDVQDDKINSFRTILAKKFLIYVFSLFLHDSNQMSSGPPSPYFTIIQRLHNMLHFFLTNA